MTFNHSMAFSQLVCSIVGKGGLRSTRSAGNAGFKRSWCLPWDRHMAHMAFVNTRVAVNMMKHYETSWIRLFVLPLPTTWNCKCVELGVLLTVLSSKVFLQSTSVRRCGTLIVPCVSWVLATSNCGSALLAAFRDFRGFIGCRTTNAWANPSDQIAALYQRSLQWLGSTCAAQVCGLGQRVRRTEEGDPGSWPSR